MERPPQPNPARSRAGRPRRSHGGPGRAWEAEGAAGPASGGAAAAARKGGKEGRGGTPPAAMQGPARPPSRAVTHIA